MRKAGRTVGAHFAMLAYHTEFQGEPEDLRDEFQRLSRLHTPSRLSGQPV